ncbi:GT2 family glycosyltransferase [Rhodoblastus acidophilus]|uniref:glycosyltransferase family 2 protein n=1 Tax=Rhodoblastus acidophilus TaxID=1074 RepID=UPI0022258680|nr:glycosyltransferase [Rhodoblastus acidophilus]MCW2283512.1 GT2 family glycosyltransferase [Rhodoblastus acidophilus]MCW2332372.1 GT2 family glycosyltransferase [Rhodoblastus acidophilus]
MAPAGAEPEAALVALHCGDAQSALAYADRWRRIGGASVASLMTRSEAARLAGFDDLAQADLVAALARDPLNPLGARKVLERNLRDLGSGAAKALLARSADEAAGALAHLAACGAAGAAAIRYVPPAKIEGWAAWRADRTASVSIFGERVETFALTPDPADPRARFFGCAAAFSLEATDRESVLAQVSAGDAVLASVRLPWRGRETRAQAPCGPGTATIVIPVYDDLDATRACLDCVDAVLHATADVHVLILDDASPTPALSEYLRQFSRRSMTRLVVNPRNRGYVGTVNRALSLIPDGDVLLLNADTLVAPDIVTRFRRIARRDPRIGAINPLSNHGEFVSFPKPFVENAFDEGWTRVHETAGAVNRDIVVDTPASIGFCLYLTRACLNAVGALCEEYDNGYLEDADFALRIREAGFRNVCAPSIFTPHLGSRSFRGEKRQLVARNHRVLKRRFPAHEAECDAYMLLDPLAAAREKIERALIADAPGRRLLIGPARARAILTLRARVLVEQGGKPVIGLCSHDGAGWRLRLQGFGGAPQKLDIALDADAAVDLFGALSPETIEIAGEGELAPALLRTLTKIRAPLLRLVAEMPMRTNALAMTGEIPLDAMSRAACGDFPLSVAACVAEAGPALGIILPEETSQTLSFLLDLANTPAAGRAIVLGGTSIDARLMGRGLFVTGPIGDEQERVARQYGVGRYLLPYRSSHYWALESWRRVRALPAAYFDWSGANFRECAEDLSLHPSSDTPKTLLQIEQWLETNPSAP